MPDPGERNRALLERARGLAGRGAGEVEPNPRVGALALSGDAVVGEGWHAFWGGAHAEEAALLAAGGAAVDGLVVTLEPCASSGEPKKRPPCTELLKDRGIRRVLVGCEDPRLRGRGLRELAGAGIQVLGPFPTPGLEALLRRFREALGRTRPWVLAKWAMSLDGKAATRTRSSRGITEGEALDFVHALRARCDGVCIGTGTLLADDPELTVRRVEGRTPIRIVFDPLGGSPPGSRLFETGGEVWILLGDEVPETIEAGLRRPGVRTFRLPLRKRTRGRPGLDIREALALLYQEGLRRLLLEGGGKLAGDFFDAGCLDQCLTLLGPRLVGGREAPTPLEGLGCAEMEGAPRLQEIRTWSLGSCLALGGFLPGGEA